MRSINKKKKSDHSGPGHERYLLTYADLITLLLGLFIILYASAQVDTSKYREYAAALNQYFNKEAPTTGGNGVMNGQRGLPQPVLPTTSEKNIDQITQQTEQALQSQITSGGVTLERSVDGLTIRLSERLLFESGKADLQPTSLSALDSITAVLRGIRQQIFVEGYTDSIPIRTFQYESNWHLSTQRALNVAYYCIQNGLPQQNVTISGNGDRQPVADNSTPEGRAANRRVSIVIKELPQHVATDEGYITSDNAQSSDNK